MGHLRNVFLTIYFVIGFFLFTFFEGGLWVWLSFFCNFVVLTGVVVYHLFIEREYSPFLSAYIVFNFLFFLVAPIVQINNFGIQPTFVTEFPYDRTLAIYTNGLICVFHISFMATYMVLKHGKFFNKVPTLSPTFKKLLPIWIVVLFGVCLIVALVSINFMRNELYRPSWMSSPYSVSTLLMYKKVFFLLPFAGILLCYQYYKKKKTKLSNILIIGALMIGFMVLLLWFKNPLTEKRNALGPIYISLIFLFIPILLNKNIKTLFFLFFTMVILFPLSAIFTHSDATLEEIVENPSIFFEQMKGGGITSAFNTLNYDAFANIMTTMHYVREEGLSWGYQLLSALFFFVPRGLWEDKPLSTGQLIGNYLIDDYGFTYANLSNPLVSEGYINFGIFGVILLAVVLAIVLVKLLAWLKSDDYIKKIMAFYFAIHLIFLLRGDFTNAYSYYIGTLAGVWGITKGIGYLLKAVYVKK